MKNKTTIELLTILCFTFFILLGGSLFMISCKEQPSKNARLVVYDTTADLNNITVYKDGYSTMPLIKVLEVLDIAVKWQGRSIAVISYGSSQMTLSLTEKTLYTDAANVNWLDCVPGNTHYFCEVTDGDVIVDNTTMSCALYQLGVSASITEDYESGIVTIAKK